MPVAAGEAAAVGGCHRREPGHYRLDADYKHGMHFTALVKAWQSGALSLDSMLDLFRRGEVLPEGRTNEEETRLIEVGKPEVVAGVMGAGAGRTPSAATPGG